MPQQMENDIPDHIKLLEPSIAEPTFNPYHFFQTPLELQRRVFYNRMGNLDDTDLRNKLNTAVQNIGGEIDENFEEAEVTKQEILRPPQLLYQRIQNTKMAEDNGKICEEEQPQFVQFKHMQQQCKEKQEQFPNFEQFMQVQSIIEEKDLCLSQSRDEKIQFYPITVGIRNAHEMLGVLKQESNNLNFFIRVTLFQTILNSGYDKPSNLAKPKAYLLQRQVGQEVVLPLSFILQNQVIEFSAELPHGSYFLQIQTYIDCQRIQQTNFPFKVGQYTKYDLNHVSQILVNFEYQQVGKKSIYYQCLLDISLDNLVSNQSLHFFRKNNLRLNIPFHPFVQQFVKDGVTIDFPNSRILMAVIDVNGKLQNFSLYPESKIHQIIEIVKFGNISKSSLYSYDWKAPINAYLTSVDIVGEFTPGDSVIFLIASDEVQKTNKFEQQLQSLPKVSTSIIEGKPSFEQDNSLQTQLNRCLLSGESIIMFATLSIFYDKIATRGDQLYKVCLFKGVPQFKSVTKKVLDVCDEEETISYACLPNIIQSTQFGVFFPVQIVENNIQMNQYRNIHSRMISSILLNQEIDDTQIQLLQQAVNLLNSHTVNQQMVKQIQTDLIQDFGMMDNVSFSLNCRIIKIVQYLLQAMVANSDIFGSIIKSNLSDSNYYKFLALFIIVPDALAGKLTNPFMNDVRAILLSLSSRIKVDQSQQVEGSVYNIIGFENILLNIDNLIVQAKALKEPIYQLLQLNKSKLISSIDSLFNDIYCFIEDYQNKSYLKHNFIGGKEQQETEFGCLTKASSYGILFDISAQILSNKDAMIQQIYMNKYLSDSIILMKLLVLLNRIDDSSFQKINPLDIFSRNASQTISKIFYIVCFIVRSFSGLYFVIKEEPIISCFIKFYPNLFTNEGIDIHYIYQDMCLITYYIQMLFKNNKCFHQDQFIQMTIQSCVYSNLQYQYEFEDSSFLMIRQIFKDIDILTYFSNKDQYLQQLLLLCFKICDQQKRVLGFVKLFNTISYGAQKQQDFQFLYELFLPIFLKSSLALLLDTETTTDDINDILIQFQVLKSFCINSETMGSLSPIIDYDNSFRMVILVGFLLLFQSKQLIQINKIMTVVNELLSQYSQIIAITSNDLQVLFSIFDYFCHQIQISSQSDCLIESIQLLSFFIQNVFHLQSIQSLLFHHLLDLAFTFMNNNIILLPIIDCICVFSQKIQITKQMKSTFILLLSQYLPLTTQLTVQNFVILLKNLPEVLSKILQNYLSSFYKLQKCYPLIQMLFADKDTICSKLKNCFSFELQQGFPTINQTKQLFGTFESTQLNTNPTLFLLINNVVEPILWQFYYLLVEYDDPRVHWILDCVFVLQFLQSDSKCIDILQLKTDLIQTYHIPDLFTSLYLIINQRSQLLMNNDSSLVSSFPTAQFQFPNYQIQNGATTIRALFLNFAASLRQSGNLLFDDLLAINEYYSKIYPHLRCLVNSDFETSPSDFYNYQQSFYTVTKGTIDFIVNLVKSIPASLITLRSGCLFTTEKSLALPEKFSLDMNELQYYNNFIFKDQKGKIIKEELALDSKVIFALLGKVISMLSERNLVDDFGLSFKFYFDHPPIMDCTNKFKAQCAEKVENIQTFPTLLINDFLFSKQSLTYGVITIFQTMRCAMMNYSNYANFQKEYVLPLVKSDIQTQMLSSLFPTIVPQFKRHIVFSKIVRHTYVDRQFVYGSFSRKYLIGIQINQKFEYYKLSLPDYQLFNSEILSFVEGIIYQLYNTSGLRYTASPIIGDIAFLNDNYCIQVLDKNTRTSAFFYKLDHRLLNIRQVSDTVLVQQAQIVYRKLGNNFVELKDFLDKFRSSNNKNTELIKRTILHMEQLAMLQDSSISMQNLASQNVSDIINQSIIQDPDDLSLYSKKEDQETLDIYILEFRKLLKLVLKGISIVVDSTHDENLLNSFSRNAFSVIMVKLQDVYETGDKGIFQEPDEATFLQKMQSLKSTNKPKKPGKK